MEGQGCKAFGRGGFLKGRLKVAYRYPGLPPP